MQHIKNSKFKEAPVTKKIQLLKSDFNKMPNFSFMYSVIWSLDFHINEYANHDDL
jgi:hypothetical protein